MARKTTDEMLELLRHVTYQDVLGVVPEERFQTLKTEAENVQDCIDLPDECKPTLLRVRAHVTKTTVAFLRDVNPSSLRLSGDSSEELERNINQIQKSLSQAQAYGTHTFTSGPYLRVALAVMRMVATGVAEVEFCRPTL